MCDTDSKMCVVYRSTNRNNNKKKRKKKLNWILIIGTKNYQTIGIFEKKELKYLRETK